MVRAAGRRRTVKAVGVLVVALLLLALAVTLIALRPHAINTSHALQIPTPGQVILPPTAPPAVTATSNG